VETSTSDKIKEKRAKIDDPIVKQQKNRMSAKKCRQKKKIYILSLEGELMKTKKELQILKEANKVKSEASIESKMEEFEIKQNEIINNYNIYNNYNSDSSPSANSTKTDLKNNYNFIQNNLLIELYKKMIKTIIPLELKVFSKKIYKI